MDDFPESKPAAAGKQPAAPLKPAVPPNLQDEFAGHGGSYTVDPATGKRTLQERTGWDPKAPTPAPQPSPQE